MAGRVPFGDDFPFTDPAAMTRLSLPRLAAALALPLVLAACAAPRPTATTAPMPAATPTAAPMPTPDVAVQAQAFLDRYTTEYQQLYTVAQDASWASNTKIVPGDSTAATAEARATERLQAFTGSTANIADARRFLADRSKLSDLQARQLDHILYNAGNNPQTVPDLVRQRVAAEVAQTQKLYGFDYMLAGKPVTTNGLDDILRKSTNLPERRAAWEASKAIGPTLKPGILALRDLRNGTVQALGYSDFFAYQVSDYGMTTPEMLADLDRINRELRPLYRELHTWARYELAKKYHRPVPDQIPADWLPNRWAQDWSGLVDVAGLDVDAALKGKSPDEITKAGEDFYVSLGFRPLPASFYEKSSLYPLPAGSPFKKNNHASAWHMDLANDVRSLMSIEPNAEWYETVHHELGHIYYYQSYSTPQVPILLREGANRAFHEAIGSMMGLASGQRPYLVGRGLISPTAKIDTVRQLLKEALSYVVFVPFAAGTMTQFEHDLYANHLPADSLNARWWADVARYQGVVPPGVRGEQFADALTKTHINDDPAQYYDYALSYILLFQLHDHIARDILHQNPRATNYYGSKPVGDFLKTILAPGATADWRVLLRQSTGRDLSAQPMLDYFAPLMAYLKEANKGRKATLADL